MAKKNKKQYPGYPVNYKGNYYYDPTTTSNIKYGSKPITTYGEAPINTPGAYMGLPGSNVVTNPTTANNTTPSNIYANNANATTVGFKPTGNNLFNKKLQTISNWIAKTWENPPSEIPTGWYGITKDGAIKNLGNVHPSVSGNKNIGPNIVGATYYDPDYGKGGLAVNQGHWNPARTATKQRKLSEEEMYYMYVTEYGEEKGKKKFNDWLKHKYANTTPTLGGWFGKGQKTYQYKKAEAAKERNPFPNTPIPPAGGFTIPIEPEPEPEPEQEPEPVKFGVNGMVQWRS